MPRSAGTGITPARRALHVFDPSTGPVSPGAAIPWTGRRPAGMLITGVFVVSAAQDTGLLQGTWQRRFESGREHQKPSFVLRDMRGLFSLFPSNGSPRHDGLGAGSDVPHGGAGVLVAGLARDESQRDPGLAEVSGGAVAQPVDRGPGDRAGLVGASLRRSAPAGTEGRRSPSSRRGGGGPAHEQCSGRPHPRSCDLGLHPSYSVLLNTSS